VIDNPSFFHANLPPSNGEYKAEKASSRKPEAFRRVGGPNA